MSHPIDPGDRAYADEQETAAHSDPPALDPFNLNGQAVAADLVRVLAERDALREELRGAADLLRNARCTFTDPGLARAWGRRRRALQDAALRMTE